MHRFSRTSRTHVCKHDALNQLGVLGPPEGFHRYKYGKTSGNHRLDSTGSTHETEHGAIARLGHLRCREAILSNATGDRQQGDEVTPSSCELAIWGPVVDPRCAESTETDAVFATDAGELQML
jgi:hypothetical protein